MIAFGIDPEIATTASSYVWICIPGVLCYSWQTCLNKFLAGQRITKVGMYANIAASVVHWGFASLLVLQFEMGIIGVAISSSFQFMIRFAVTLGYIRFSGQFDAPEISVPLFGHPENYLNWKSQISLSLQCMSLSIWSWWAMDIFTMIATEMEPGILTA